MSQGYHAVKQNMWSNAVSNYVRTILAMTVGLFTFRMLYQALSKEAFGFWSLLWSVFGYGILLDFGFGFTAQKRVAELSVKQDWDRLSRVLSTIFFFYLGVSGLVVCVVLLASHPIVRGFGVSPQNIEEFRRVMVLFFLGIGLAFPLGIFPEILRGQQRIRLANNLMSIALVLRLVLTWMALHYHWGFMAIMAISLAMSLGPDCLAATYALRWLPHVKIRPTLFSRAMIRDTMTFSLFAYLNTATNIIMGKTDQLVLGLTLSVSAVAIYQAGFKAADIFNAFSRQLQDTLSPAAAHLHASGDRHALRDLLVSTTRWSVLLATPLYLLCAFYMDDLIRLLTGDAVISAETRWVGHLLLFWFYTTIPTHSVPKRIFMMCGHERLLLWLALGEALSNVVLSVGLVLYFRSVVGVAIGSLVPSFLFGWFYMWAWSAREAGLSGWALFRETILPAWWGVVPMLLVLVALRFVVLAPGGDERVAMFVEGGLAGVVGVAGIWFLALKSGERGALAGKLWGRFARKGAA